MGSAHVVFRPLSSEHLGPDARLQLVRLATGANLKRFRMLRYPSGGFRARKKVAKPDGIEGVLSDGVTAIKGSQADAHI
jgi:hypothetical protein